jgi:hypothetical protein
MPDSFFEAYSLIKHTDFGEPLSIRYKNCDINADYLASGEEWSFLTNNNIFEAIDNITEIGGGGMGGLVILCWHWNISNRIRLLI